MLFALPQLRVGLQQLGVGFNGEGDVFLALVAVEGKEVGDGEFFLYLGGGGVGGGGLVELG